MISTPLSRESRHVSVHKLVAYNTLSRKNSSSASSWVEVPGKVRNCPVGWEYFDREDLVIVRKGIDESVVSKKVLDCLPYEWLRSYTILNRYGKMMYMAFEEDLKVSKKGSCFTKKRPFNIHVTDMYGNTMFSFERTRKSCGCMCCACLPCSQDEVDVVTEEGEPVAFIRQACSVLRPKYQIHIQSSLSTIVFQSIRGNVSCFSPCCMCPSSNFTFTFNNPGRGKYKGKVFAASHYYSSGNHILFSDADLFCVEFPASCEAAAKSAFLGAGFLFNVLYFSRLPEGYPRGVPLGVSLSDLGVHSSSTGLQSPLKPGVLSSRASSSPLDVAFVRSMSKLMDPKEFDSITHLQPPKIQVHRDSEESLHTTVSESPSQPGVMNVLKVISNTFRRATFSDESEKDEKEGEPE